MRTIFSLALALAVTSALVEAQDLRGTVRGTVFDSSGGVVAGAKLTLRNINTNVAVDRDSSATGAYVFDFVSPGTYSLVVGIQGFRGFQQDNILVQTRSDITVDAKLEVGAVNETVRVEAAPVTVQFTKTTMETTLDTKMSNSLPIIHRNPFLLLQLDPQVTFTSTSQEQSPFHHWAGSRLDVGGGTQLKNDILVDGSPNTWGPKTNYVPPMDAVSELNVQQNATDAEFGHSAGGIVSLQMKSGSNDWHGTVYYFGRNPKLNARPDSTTPTPSLIRHNVWGVTSGNPIVKNKLFNYIAYEGQNLREPINLIKTLPTARERTGDFSQTMFLDAGRTGMKPIFDPWTTQTNGSNVTRMPFPGNIIPRSQMDPVSLRFLNDIWAPNGPGDDITQINNYRLTFARVYDYYNWSNRTDWNVNDKWKIFGRFSRYHTNVASPNPAGTPAGSTGGSERNSMTAVGDAVWTMNANTVVSFRGSYGKPVDRFIDPIAEIKSFGDFFPQNPTFFDSYAKSLPVTYYPGLNLGGNFGRGGYWYSAPDFWNGQGKISRNVGRHYLKMGGEFRRYRGNSSLPQPLQFFFPAANTANTYINTNTRLSGSEWATFLLGAIGDNSRARNVPALLARNYFYGFYLQDDFKLSQNITLNLGLRWEYDTPIVDRDGRLSRTLDLTNPIPEFQGANAPNLGTQVMAIRRTAPQYNGAWIHTPGAGDGAFSNSKLGFQPRFGLAWRLSDRMSFRAGYSRYAIMPSVDIEGGINLNDVVPYPGYQQDSFPLPTVQGVPAARFSNPWPSTNPLTPPVEKRLGRYTELGSTAQSIIWNQNLGTSYNDRFSFSLQRQLPSQIVVDATYFMSFGFNQRYQQQLNNIDPRFGFQFQNAVNAQVPNPFFNVLPFDKFPGGLRNVRNAAVSDLLRPYPHYGPITMWNAEGVHRRYRSIQFKAQRPFVNGFNFLIGYNYNNARNDEFFPDGVQVFLNNLSLQDSPNARHKFNIGGIYELPFGKGRKYASSMNKGVNLVLGGWALSGIYQQVSGEFLRMPAALVSGNPAISNPTRDRWFDTTKVTRQPAFTQRTNPLQFPGFNGPGVVSLDLTLGKEFQFKEKYTFEIKLESYNLPNTFNGANPQLNPDSSLFGRVTGQRNTYFGRQFQYTSRIRW